MSNISDILLAIRSLDSEDLRAFAETSKKCITEDTRRRLDAIATIPEEDEAREIPITQTYPFIYISNDDLKKATATMLPNPCKDSNQPREIQEIDNPVIVSDGNFVRLSQNVAIAVVKDLKYQFLNMIVDGVQQPVDRSVLKINNTRRDEKVVFISSRIWNAKDEYNSLWEFGHFIVMTNFGNIHVGTKCTQKSQGGCNNGSYWPPPIVYPTFKPMMVNDRPIEVVPADIELDDFCKVPQIFVDLMSFTLRSFGSSYNQAELRCMPLDQDFFKALCRKYNKDRRDLQNRVETLEKRVEIGMQEHELAIEILNEKHAMAIEDQELDLAREYQVRYEKTIETHEAIIQELEESHSQEITVLQTRCETLLEDIAKQRLENSVLCDKIAYLADTSVKNFVLSKPVPQDNTFKYIALLSWSILLSVVMYMSFN